MFHITSNLSKTVGKVAKWTQKQVQEFNNLGQSVKNSIYRATNKESVLDLGCKHGTQQQLVHKSWKSALQNFKTTLKGNGTRLKFQNGLSENSYFRNDFLWRRARRAHLIAFGGLFLFQEERDEALIKLDSQYHVFSTVCSNIKMLFPSFTTDDALPVNCGSKLDDYILENVVDSKPNSVVYTARLKPDENDIAICEDAPECESLASYIWLNNLSFDLSVSTSEEKSAVRVGDFCVKAITHHNGMRNIETVVKDSENELICCGRGQFGGHVGMDGKWPRKKLPPHPNIVRIEEAFIDYFTRTTNVQHAFDDPSISELYPMSTKALFLVTKWYRTTLKQYLEQNTFAADAACIAIIQLLEAVAHLQAHNIAHRDIDTNNIVLEWDLDGHLHILLGEFGNSYCAVSWKDMKVPFQHETLDTRVGELSVQAPEISKAQPGSRKFVNYQNSDSWSAGVVTYEILIGRNPFKVEDSSGRVLDSRTYREEDLPSLDDQEASSVLRTVVKMLLRKDLKQRLTASEAADVLHLDLFALPPSFNLSSEKNCKELRSWVVAHCAEVFARKRKNGVLYHMCQSFFARLDTKKLSEAFCLWMSVKEASM